jgi:hypothetical protein
LTARVARFTRPGGAGSIGHAGRQAIPAHGDDERVGSIQRIEPVQPSVAHPSKTATPRS